MHKKELRQIYRKKRDLLSSKQVIDFSLDIANKVISLPIWRFSFYHIFLSISSNNEVDTQPLLSLLQGRDKNIVVPKALPKGLLKNYLLLDSTVLKNNKWGIPEPTEGIEITEQQLEVIFIPLLAFDRKGNRVGYGGGYYDRLLEKCSNKTLKVGLSFFEAENEIEDVTDTDIAMDFCVTPKTVYSF